MGSAYPPNPAKYPWFSYRTQIKTLTVEYGLTSLGVSTFRNLPYLESVLLPVSLTTIDESTFSNCPLLSKIIFPSSVTYIGNRKSLYEVRFYGLLEEWCELETGKNNDKLYTADEYYFNNELHAHSFEETVIKEAPCVKSGLVAVNCLCGYHGENKTPANGEHKLGTVTVDSTCTHTGKEYSVCEVCDRTIGGITVLPLKNHVSGEWETDESGKTVKKCTACSKVFEEKETETEETPEDVPENTPEDEAAAFVFVEIISGNFKIITDYVIAFFNHFFGMFK